MVHTENYQGKKIHLCDSCQFGYIEKKLAQTCENRCKKFNACALEITKHAIKKF